MERVVRRARLPGTRPRQSPVVTAGLSTGRRFVHRVPVDSPIWGLTGIGLKRAVAPEVWRGSACARSGEIAALELPSHGRCWWSSALVGLRRKSQRVGAGLLGWCRFEGLFSFCWLIASCGGRLVLPGLGEPALVCPAGLALWRRDFWCSAGSARRDTVRCGSRLGQLGSPDARHAPGPAGNGRRTRAARSAHRDRGADSGAASAAAVTPSTTAVRAASSASSGSPLTTRSSGRFSLTSSIVSPTCHVPTSLGGTGIRRATAGCFRASSAGGSCACLAALPVTLLRSPSCRRVGLLNLRILVPPQCMG